MAKYREVLSAILENVLELASGSFDEDAQGQLAEYEHLLDSPDRLSDLLEAVGAEEEAQLSAVRMAEDAWVPYVGKRGPKKGKQVGWQNRETKRIVYGDRKPGQGRKPREKPTRESMTAHAKKVLENPTAEGVLDLIVGLIGLKVVDIKAVRDAIGAKGGRTKSDLARKIRERIENGPKLPVKDEKGDVEEPEVETPEEVSDGAGSGPGADDGAGGGGDDSEADEAGGAVEEEAGGPAPAEGDQGGSDAGQSDGSRPARRVPAKPEAVKRRLGRMIDFFRKKAAEAGHDDTKGYKAHNVVEWMERVRDHIEAVGTEEALAALGEDVGGEGGEVQYEGGWDDMGHFAEAYLNRHGITPLFQVDWEADPSKPLISSATPTNEAGLYRDQEGDFVAADPTIGTKLDEAKKLPGLETSEDIGVVMGREVSQLSSDVIAKLDEQYGAGQWIVKPYGSEAFAGYGIFFPQRARQLQEDARNVIWESGAELAKYGFSQLRDESGKIIGIKHDGGDEYRFGTPEYENTINGEVRRWADAVGQDRYVRDADGNQINVGSAAASEHGAALPPGKFMVQPAFPVVGISDEERARGVTFKKGGEGRVHIVTRNGKAELVPHATWLKKQDLPVVFEDDDTRAMAQAAVDAINALPESERQGQIYAPDVVKTKDGYKVVEANPADKTGASGYLGDNPFIIDAYVSHLSGKTPAHVQFLRKLLSDRKRGGKTDGEKQPDAGAAKGTGSGKRPERNPVPAGATEPGGGGGGESGAGGVSGPQPRATPRLDPAQPERGINPQGVSDHLTTHGVTELPEGSGEGGRWDQPAEVRDEHNRQVLEAARKGGLFIEPQALSRVTSSPNVGGQEHDVHEDVENGRFYKFTKGGHFGQNKDVHEYLKRHEIANQLWPSLGYTFHGITQSPFNGTPQVVTSMARVEGTHPEQNEIHDWFRQNGFEPAEGEEDPDEIWTWRDPKTGTIIGDTQSFNFIKTPGGLVPIDVDIRPGE